MLAASEIRGLYAILPTPAKPGAERLDATDTVDLAETARVVDAVIRDGSTGLIVSGTTGECATLSHSDWEKFAACVLETAARRVPVFVGTTALGGHEIVRRMRFIQERGADGTLLGLPMWQPVTTPAAITFYTEMSQLFPKLAIMVYANARAFRYDFPLDFWDALSQRAPTVTSAKFSRPKNLTELIQRSRGRINFVPNDLTVDHFYATSPETTTACWATAAAMGPAPIVALMRAIEKRDAAAIPGLVADLAWANEPLKPIFLNPEEFAKYNIQVEKVRINAAGYCKSGPVRPPYSDFPEAYRTASEECGKRWATLCDKLAGAAPKEQVA
jgi:dihydrodipicolinate synthase/N-acetylneuraminate lyase